MRSYTVYRHVNKQTGGVYVGITCRPVEERWKNGSAYKTSCHFYRAINKYGWDCFSHEVLFTGLSKEEAQTKEIELIAHYREVGHECYNILAGGNLGRAGVPMSPEAKEKMSKAKLGWKMSDEQRKYISESRKAWLFCDSPKGADSSAIVYSLVETAKANGLDPFAYLNLLLTELPYLGKNPAPDRLEQFMPWMPAIRKCCALSSKKTSSGDL